MCVYLLNNVDFKHLSVVFFRQPTSPSSHPFSIHFFLQRSNCKYTLTLLERESIIVVTVVDQQYRIKNLRHSTIQQHRIVINNQQVCTLHLLPTVGINTPRTSLALDKHQQVKYDDDQNLNRYITTEYIMRGHVYYVDHWRYFFRPCMYPISVIVKLFFVYRIFFSLALSMNLKSFIREQDKQQQQQSLNIK